jgi:phosphoglucosamine mutase
MESLAAQWMMLAAKQNARSEAMSEAGARKLFGTDGIRGVAGQPPLDAKTIYATGLALGHSIRGKAGPKVLLGRDTRESSPWIAAMITAALRETEVRVESAGVVPTPAVAFLARTRGFDAGVVISASHNPWRDNGIKLFGPDGFKLPDAIELAMEDDIVRHAETADVPDLKDLPPVEDNSALRSEYVQFLMDCVPELRLQGLRIVADCANGAASAVAPELFAKLGARIPEELVALNVAPDGRNINDNCGALHPEWVAAEVQRRGASIGVTFDGDADRCMLAGARGNVINGDAILLMAGRDLKMRGLLSGDMVVATTMSNMGLEAALKRSGIRMLRASVGDRYVLEQMQQNNAALGGEQSGHILFPHLATTGDGLLTALVVLDLVARSGKSIDELTSDLKVFPQVIVNVKVREKKPLDGIPAVAERIRAAEEDLRDSGRVVIRYSGTEPLARVMIEAESEEAMRRHANAIAEAIKSELGI